jgi:hypothetical protein
MLTLPRGVLLVIGLISMVACQSPTTSTSGDVNLTFSPSPASPHQSSGRTYTIKYTSKPDETYSYAWVAEFAATLTNTSDTGVTITGVSITVQQASGGIAVSSTTGESEHYDYSTAPDSNRVEGNGGTANSAITVWYTLPNGGAESLITVSYSFMDDDDVTFSVSETIRVVP